MKETKQDIYGLPVLSPAEEFQNSLSAGVSRRSFIELVGFSVGAIALSSCRAPGHKIVPYAKQPVEFTPGVASWYATTCDGCTAGCGVLAKVRDGRPIKLEGNPDHPLSKGGLCAVAHGLVFSLYDSERLQQPLIRGKQAKWEDIDSQITQKLTAIKSSGGKVRLLTSPITSPTSRDVIAKFLGQFADGKHITYEPVSTSAIRDAHRRSHGLAATPVYHFDKAKLVVSFGADFLGTWISPVQFAKDYSAARNLQDERSEMLRHIQFESRLSLTGSNADKRYTVSPAEEVDALMFLARLVAEKNNAAAPGDLRSFSAERLSPVVQNAIVRASHDLLESNGEALVISGSNNVDAQLLVNFINETTGGYGKTVDLANAFSHQESDGDIADLVQEMNSGQVAALLISNANPAYDYYASQEFTRALKNVSLKVSFNPTLDETSSLADYVCPTHHFLESWNDSAFPSNIYSLTQPTIAPLFNTRAYQESLMTWSGDNTKFYDALRQSWKEKLFTKQNKLSSFDEFWDQSLQQGVFVADQKAAEQPRFNAREIGDAVEHLKQRSIGLDGKLSVVLYEKVTMRNGVHANNPWLHEVPDPITKITWDNYAAVSPNFAERRQLEEGGVIRLTHDSTFIDIPVHIQPGQHDNSIAVALGYGRTRAGKVGNNIGVNAYPFVGLSAGTFQYTIPEVEVKKLTRRTEFAKTQTHDSIEGRPLIKEISLAEYISDQKNGEHREEKEKSTWTEHTYKENRWGMAVDLNACTGCSACIISCQAENNIPVVGKDEVRRRREMHWIRIDRYYDGPQDNPKVAFQPILCSHCENASCESVCPVLATVHSSEGLNMQVYNRCVGTRYCENNCYIKGRRFNWFDYSHSDLIANLALNPDVTVRSRGVMEKCSLCVQRIEAAKIKSRNEGRPVEDGEIKTACQQSCPADAIAFGNLVDLKSRVNRLKHDGRNYILLEELNLRPALSYLAKVRNVEEA